MFFRHDIDWICTTLECCEISVFTVAPLAGRASDSETTNSLLVLV